MRSPGTAGSASKRFLLVPYHLIGAESLEAAILGGYVDHVRREHPDAPLPAVYRAQGLLDDAREIRDSHGGRGVPRAGFRGTDGGEWGDVERSLDEPEHRRGVRARRRTRRWRSA